jgi:hypothetical protein
MNRKIFQTPNFLPDAGADAFTKNRQRYFAIAELGTAYWLRTRPGTPSSGSPDDLGTRIIKTRGTPVNFRVLGKKRLVNDDNPMWYLVELADQILYNSQEGGRPMRKGETGWIVAQGISVGAMWSTYIEDLAELLKQTLHDHPNIDLNTAITYLRQASHTSDVPFDDLIGRGHNNGAKYTNTLPYVAGQSVQDGHGGTAETKIQLFKDYRLVQLSNGDLLDMQHILVGLDVLLNQVINQSIPFRILGVTVATLDVGGNVDAATWSGDIGAAVADYVVHHKQDTEDEWTASARKQNPKWTATALESERKKFFLDFYYRSVCPDSDMYPDIYSFGLHAIKSERLNGGNGTQAGLIIPLLSNLNSNITLIAAKSFREFFRYYTVNYSVPITMSPRTMPPDDYFYYSIDVFSIAFWTVRKLEQNLAAILLGPDRDALASVSRLYTRRFVDWLEAARKRLPLALFRN